MSSPRFALHSPQKYHEVRVPFDSETGWIIVNANFSGKKVKAVVDTGMSFVLWSKSLSLPSNSGGVKYSGFVPYYTATPCPAEWRILSNMRLGEYELQNCPSISYDSPVNKTPSVLPACFIGDSALAQTVLTIDYRSHQLIFRDESYDVTKSPVSTKDYLMPLLPEPEEAHSFRPIVAGTIAGFPVRVMLDTGLAASNIGLANTSIVAKVQHSTNYRLLTNKQTGTKALPNTNWSIGELVDQTPIDLMPGFTPKGVDCAVGYEFLRNYRITIDYQRQKVMLQWNPLLADAQAHIDARKAELSKAPNDPYVHIELGKALMFTGQYQKAEQEFMFAISLDKNNSFAHFKLGQCYYYLENYPKSVHEFGIAIEINPSEAYLHRWKEKAIRRLSTTTTKAY